MKGSKAEALKAIDHAIAKLRGPALEELERRHVVATLEYGREQVEGIDELKRARKATTPAEVQAP